MSDYERLVIVLTVAATCVAVSPAAFAQSSPAPTETLSPSQSQSSTLRVEWIDQRLTITARRAPLAAVLTEVARRTGSTLIGLEKARGVVNADIRSRRLLDALRVLLESAGMNYMSTSSIERVTLVLHGAAESAKSLPCATPAECAPSSPDLAPGTTDVPIDDIPPPLVAAPAADEVSRLHREGAFGSAATESSLLDLTKSANHDVRILALQALALQSSPMGLQAIQGALSDSHPFVRAEAMDLLLSQTPGRETVGRLGELAAHSDPAVRGTAAMALGEQAGADAEFLLHRALKDDDPSVRSFAAQSLKQKQVGEKAKR